MVVEQGEFPPKTGIISFLDILGTKAVSNDNEARELLTKVNQIYDDFEELKNGMSKMMALAKNVNFIVGNSEISPFKEEEKIPQLGLEVSTFSDTVILALYGDKPITDSFFLYLFGFFLIPLFRRALVNGIFLRGTISIGKFYLLMKSNRILLIGPAVYDAAQSYENTDWVGVSASPTASLTLEQEHGIESFESLLDKAPMPVLMSGLKKGSYDLKRIIGAIKGSFINYDIPTKDGIEKNGWALSWPTFFDSSATYHTQEEVQQILSEKLTYKKYQHTSINKEIYRKYKNCKDFFDLSITTRKPIDMTFIQPEKI